MGGGVYVKPQSASALDYGFGGGGFGGSPGTSSRPIVSPMRPINPSRAMAPVGNRPARLPGSGARNLNGFNNRAQPPRGFAQPVQPKTTTARPFTGGPGGRGSKGRGFGELLRNAGTQQQRPQARGFGPTAGNPPVKSAPRPIPVDTPTPGAKRPFNFRAPFANIPAGSLPGNPFARSPQPFKPSGADRLPPITYPGQFPIGELTPGATLRPGIPAAFTGGQGVGIQYLFDYTWDNLQGNRQTIERGGYGPIVGVYEEPNELGYLATGYVARGGAEKILVQTLYLSQKANAVISNIRRLDGQPDTSGDPPPIQQGEIAPNRLRPTTPRPLPQATPTPTTTPTPQFLPPAQPAKQPLPYISPDPVPLQPGQAPLPDELAPVPRPQTKPKTKPGNKTEKSRFGKSGGNSPRFTPQTAFSTGVAVGRALAGSATSAINSTEAQEIKELIKNGIPLKTGQSMPVNTPVNGINNGKTIDPLINPIKETPPNAPPEKVNNCPEIPSQECRYDSKNISGKCDSIINKLEVDYSLEWNLPECEQEFLIERQGNKSGQGLDGIAQQIESLYQAIKVLHNNTRCQNEIIVGVPDDYGRRPETNRPTLILFYKEKKGQKWGNSTYTTTIFYPRADVIRQIFEYETLTPPSRNIGNGFATLVLPDDSRLRAFGLTETGAISTLSWMVEYCQIAPSGWQNQIIKGSRNGLTDKLVYCRKAEYYPNGFKAEVKPEASKYFANET